MWKSTPNARWQEMTHFLMQNAPQMGHRIRFVKALVYAYTPEPVSERKRLTVLVNLVWRARACVCMRSYV